MRLAACAVLVSVSLARTARDQLTYNVLVAGYGPWGPYEYNPSAATAETLNNTCQPVGPAWLCFHGWNLTVDHKGAGMVAHALEAGQLQQLGIDAVITLGLESTTKGLKLELAGANVLADSRPAPIDRRRPLGALVPPTLDTARLDIAAALEPIATTIRAQSNADVSDPLESMWSRDAGTFFCNEALYRTAAAIRRLRVTHPRENSLLLPFLFVHLPEPSLAPVERVVAPAIAQLAKAMLVDVLPQAPTAAAAWRVDANDESQATASALIRAIKEREAAQAVDLAELKALMLGQTEDAAFPALPREGFLDGLQRQETVVSVV